MSRWRLNWKSPSRLRRGPRNLPHVATVVQFAWNGWINPPIRSNRAYRPGVYQRLIDLPVLAWPINFVDWEKEGLGCCQSVWLQWGGLAAGCKCETWQFNPCIINNATTLAIYVSCMLFYFATCSSDDPCRKSVRQRGMLLWHRGYHVAQRCVCHAIDLPEVAVNLAHRQSAVDLL
jgi:hypothetical protein